MEKYINIDHCKDCSLRLPIFDCLTPDQFEIINKTRFQVRFRPGEMIFKQGTIMSHIICITEGLVKIYLEGINKNNIILRFARPVTLIGGPGMFVDNRHYVSAVAIEESMACFLDTASLKTVFEQNSQFAVNLLSHVNQMVISNFAKFVDLTQKHMRGRIAGALLYLHHHIFDKQNGEIVITRQDLAELTAMSMESAIRILREFKDDDIISSKGNAILINNLDTLDFIYRKG